MSAAFALTSHRATSTSGPAFAVYDRTDAGTAGRTEASMTAALWVAAIAMIVVGVAGTVHPALPGLVLVFGGIVLAAWIDDFARISPWTVGGLAVLTLLG